MPDMGRTCRTTLAVLLQRDSPLWEAAEPTACSADLQRAAAVANRRAAAQRGEEWGGELYFIGVHVHTYYNITSTTIPVLPILYCTTAESDYNCAPK